MENVGLRMFWFLVSGLLWDMLWFMVCCCGGRVSGGEGGKGWGGVGWGGVVGGEKRGGYGFGGGGLRNGEGRGERGGKEREAGGGMGVGLGGGGEEEMWWGGAGRWRLYPFVWRFGSMHWKCRPNFSACCQIARPRDRLDRLDCAGLVVDGLTDGAREWEYWIVGRGRGGRGREGKGGCL